MARRLPTEEELRATAAEFERLLKAKAPEPVWQKFLAKHPFVFSRALPVRMNPWDVRPMGREGKSEPDFIFYDQDCPSRSYGVIELKRPDQKIVRAHRKTTIALTRDADGAIKQAQAYGDELARTLLDPSVRRSSLVLGNDAYLFVIMGLSDTLAARIVADVDEMQLRRLIPPEVRVITYDQLLERFVASLPPVIVVLSPESASVIFRLSVRGRLYLAIAPAQFDEAQNKLPRLHHHRDETRVNVLGAVLHDLTPDLEPELFARPDGASGIEWRIAYEDRGSARETIVSALNGRVVAFDDSRDHANHAANRGAILSLDIFTGSVTEEDDRVADHARWSRRRTQLLAGFTRQE